MLYMEHICQSFIKNVLEAKLQKTTTIKEKLRTKEQKKNKQTTKNQTKAITVELVAFRTES